MLAKEVQSQTAVSVNQKAMLSIQIAIDNMTKRTTVIRTPFLRSKHINTFILKYIYQYLELLKIEHDERKTGVSAQTK